MEEHLRAAVAPDGTPPTYYVVVRNADNRWTASVASASPGASPAPVSQATEASNPDEARTAVRARISTILGTDDHQFDVKCTYPDAPASQPGFRTTKGFVSVEFANEVGRSSG